MFTIQNSLIIENFIVKFRKMECRGQGDDALFK